MPTLIVKRIFQTQVEKHGSGAVFIVETGHLTCAGALFSKLQGTNSVYISSSITRRRLIAVLDTWVSGGLTVGMDAAELLMTARMARLNLSPEELERLSRGVEQMLGHFSHMREIDVEGLAPTTHALLRENRLREDAVTSQTSADTLIGNAAEREDRFIVIPNVL
jgi:aspartyl-tRNA(Asn)/glutamyl-tRNA(Gln) amidotransferase subunit C